jgi:hypothetical protein
MRRTTSHTDLSITDAVRYIVFDVTASRDAITDSERILGTVFMLD